MIMVAERLVNQQTHHDYRLWNKIETFFLVALELLSNHCLKRISNHLKTESAVSNLPYLSKGTERFYSLSTNWSPYFK